VEEGLRMYPPVPNGLPRRVPAGGAEINGKHIPAGVGYNTCAEKTSLIQRIDTNQRNSSCCLQKPKQLPKSIFVHT